MTDLVVVAFVAVLVFGAMRIPAIGDAIGRAVKKRRAGSGAPDPHAREASRAQGESARRG